MVYRRGWEEGKRRTAKGREGTANSPINILFNIIYIDNENPFKF